MSLRTYILKKTIYWQLKLYIPGSVNGHGPCTKPDQAAIDTIRIACIIVIIRQCHSLLRSNEKARTRKYKVAHPVTDVTAPATECFLMSADHSEKITELLSISAKKFPSTVFVSHTYFMDQIFLFTTVTSLTTWGIKTT